jgi:hypothetical protein
VASHARAAEPQGVGRLNLGEVLNPTARFFLFFFVSYLLVTAGVWLLAGQPLQGSPPASGSLVVFRVMFTPFLFSAQSGERPAIPAFAFVLNSAVVSAIATVVYALVRKTRAA